MRGARFSGGEWGLSLFLSKTEGGETLRFSGDHPSTALMMMLMPGEERRGDGYDSRPRAKHAKVGWAVVIGVVSDPVSLYRSNRMAMDDYKLLHPSPCNSIHLHTLTIARC